MSDELVIEGVVTSPRGLKGPTGATVISLAFELRVPLRPLFAALAMNGLLATDSQMEYVKAADMAVKHADFLLERLAEKPEAGEVAE